MTLVIMAAGMGSRFGGLKQIEPVDEEGNFIIDYSIYDAIKAGFTKVVFIIKRENYDLFKESIGERVEKFIEVEYAFQDISDLPKEFTAPIGRIKPWGTAHAILCAKKFVQEPFIIINSDDFYGRDAYVEAAKFLKNIKNNDFVGAMIGYKLINTTSENGSVKRGICKERNGKLTELIECKIEKQNNKFIAYPLENDQSFEVQSSSLVSMNMFALCPQIFDYLEKKFIDFLNENKEDLTKEFLIPSCIFDLINNNIMEVEVLKTDAKWLGMTYKEDLDDVKHQISLLHEQKEYPENLWK